MTTNYIYSKAEVNAEGLSLEIDAVLPRADGISHDGVNVTVEYVTPLSGNQEISLANVVSNHSAGLTTQQTIKRIVEDAIIFGKDLIVTFSTENILLGITQAGKTNDVRKALREVTDALLLGSLYDAIHECREIPAEDKDVTYLTDARLLGFVNKIEVYLGQTLSTSL